MITDTVAARTAAAPVKYKAYARAVGTTATYTSSHATRSGSAVCGSSPSITASGSRHTAPTPTDQAVVTSGSPPSPRCPSHRARRVIPA